MAKTVSMSVGRVAILHDVRREISANVDVTLTHQNEIFIDKLKDFDYDIKAYTNAKFQPYIDEYNSRQKREERKKNIPYVEIVSEENEKLLQKAEDNKKKGIKTSVRKPTKLCHEYVLQIGDRETNGTLTANIEENKEYARQVVEKIKKKYPHADILLATFHADEPNGTPHLHLIIQFDGEDYKQGLKKQISMSKALELDGFERSQNRGDYAVNRWVSEIKDTIMTETLKEVLDEERDVIGEHRQHEDIVVFREKAKREEIEMARQREESTQRLDDLERKIENEEMTLFDLQMQSVSYDDIFAHYDKTIESRKEEVSALDEKISISKKKLSDIALNIGKGNDVLNSIQKAIKEAEPVLAKLQDGVKTLVELKGFIGYVRDLAEAMKDKEGVALANKAEDKRRHFSDVLKETESVWQRHQQRQAPKQHTSDELEL